MDSQNRECLVRCSGLCAVYGSVQVLCDVSMVIHKGESWFLVGPNGCGKTTLLRALLRRLQPTKGAVEWHVPYSEIGYIPQMESINPVLPVTVREIVGMGLVGSTVARQDRQNAINEALQQTGMQSLENAIYQKLSGGQKQRTLVARALTRRPCILIADEPTDGLDASAKDSLMRQLMQQREQNQVALLVVTHELGLVKKYASHVAMLVGGRAIVGPIDRVLTMENACAVYGMDAFEVAP